MTSREIRRAFLEYFAARGHRLVPSSPLVLPRDPTLLFANAGMNQFKDVFTGRERREYTRAVSVQKCLRVSGKHNDLETVGRTPRHHTFFEMLGNFSFGDYFKEDAIVMAWELMTGTWGLPPERLWVTVFGGSSAAAADAEALALWRDRIGVPAERVLLLGEAENFWRMGDTGPCGPCSEIHYDLGAELASVGADVSTPATDDRRFFEVWNLVFMQFDQQQDGRLVPLPAPSVDTGMGLERIAAVLQGKRGNYETDLFLPLIEAVAHRAGTRWGADESSDFSLRVIADHARALCFLVADGVVPANDRRGYVLRRLLRRAIRHGRRLGLDGPFLHEVTPWVVDRMGEAYPELVSAREAIVEIGRREESRFAETLSAGLGLLEQALAQLRPAGAAGLVLPGDELFRLHDTYGFPLDLARDIAAERGVALDEEGFEREMARQRSRARASWRGEARAQESGAHVEIARRHATSFEGYGCTRLDGAEILALLDAGGRPVDALVAGQRGDAVLAATPFYAEAGGQVADTGVLCGPEGRASVSDVQRPAGGPSLHRLLVETGRLAVGQAVAAEVDEARRSAVRRNHTATHLLHAALREVVGTHVKQAGSLVAPERLRFDFSHFAPVTDRALADVESLINAKVLEDLAVETAQMDLDEALQQGAMALFGEKYGERVRVVRIGEFSLELCGGTHCERSGQVGLVKLVQERGIASGTRRVEAVSGAVSLDRFREEHAIVRSLEEQLSVPRERLVGEIERRLGELRAIQRDLEARRLGLLRERLAARADHPRVVGDVRVLIERVDDVEPAELRSLADDLRRRLRSGVVVLGRAEAEKVSLLVAVTDDLKHRLPAGDLVRELGRLVGGGGGGRPDLAEAGGKDPARLDEALQAALGAIERRMQAAT
jgi:alanyl-tRNA synthetase